MSVIRNGKSYTDCRMCNGTGIDDADFTGLCFECLGMGVVPDDEDERDGFADAVDLDAAVEEL